jgi:hypothetical protein
MDLEALIHDEPDSADVFLVYADTLQRRGDPLGDVMSLHYALCQATDHERLVSLRARYEKVLAQHPDLLPDLLRQELDLDILFGLVRSAWIYRGGHESQIGPGAAQLEALLQAPCARFLSSLHLELSDEEQPNPFSVLAAAPQLGSLRQIRINDRRGPLQRRGELLDPLLETTPRLRSLHLRGQCPNLHRFASESLEHLEITTHHISLNLLTALLEPDLPNLHTLILHLNPGEGHSSQYQESVVRLIAGMSASNLKHLAIQQTPFSNLICQQLQHSDLLEQLEVLDLSGGSLTDDGASTILSQRQRYHHLERLDLSENWLDQTRPALEELGDFVELGTQRAWANSRQ